MLYTLKQVSELLEISESSVKRMETSGELKADVNAKGHFKYSMEEILRIIELRNMNSSQQEKIKQTTKNKSRIEGVKVFEIKKFISDLLDDDEISITIETHTNTNVKTGQSYNIDCLGMGTVKSYKKFLVKGPYDIRNIKTYNQNGVM